MLKIYICISGDLYCNLGMVSIATPNKCSQFYAEDNWIQQKKLVQSVDKRSQLSVYKAVRKSDQMSNFDSKIVPFIRDTIE